MDILFIYPAESEGFEPPKHANACYSVFSCLIQRINKSNFEDI